MKNLLIYLNPNKNFNAETSLLAKIQIDNSLDLGWKKKDLILVTNFPYQYQGVKAITIDSNIFCTFSPLSTKTIAVAYLLEKGMLEKDLLYWVHDFDAYQMSKIKEDKLCLEEKDLGLTDYGWSKRYCLGSYFLKSSSKDIFKQIKEVVYKERLNDEEALISLIQKTQGKIKGRCRMMNITYNFGMRKVGLNYNQAEKPLKVIHFHPWSRGRDVLDSFMYGKNELGFPIMSERLITLFNKHGIH